MKLHIFWLEKVMNFTGSSQKDTSSRVSMLQPKTLHFRFFILKVTFLIQFFGQPHMTTILLRDQFHHVFYHYPVKKTVSLIFQIAFFQGSQMLLLPQIQTTVTRF